MLKFGKNGRSRQFNNNMGVDGGVIVMVMVMVIVTMVMVISDNGDGESDCAGEDDSGSDGGGGEVGEDGDGVIYRSVFKVFGCSQVKFGSFLPKCP